MPSTINVKITFSGLCLFRSADDASVEVHIPAAERAVEYCRETLRVHRAAILVDPNRLVPGSSDVSDRLVPLPMSGLDTTLAAMGGPLSKPSRLAEFHDFVGAQWPDPQPDRRTGLLTLCGGAFIDQPQKTTQTSCSTGGWTNGQKSFELRWQDTWQGDVDGGADRCVTLTRGEAGEFELYPPQDRDELHFYVVNVMPAELHRWETQAQVDGHAAHATPQDAVDFMWYCWMCDVDTCRDIRIPKQGVPTNASHGSPGGTSPHPTAKTGMPYTCVMGGA